MIIESASTSIKTTYHSHKQRFTFKKEEEFCKEELNQNLKVTIDYVRFEAELPYGGQVKGLISPQEERFEDGRLIFFYKTDTGCPLVVAHDHILLNLFATHGMAITYYFDNYIAPSPEESTEMKDAADHALNSKIYGKITADCIRNKILKIGIHKDALLKILGEPDKRKFVIEEGISTEELEFEDYTIQVENCIVTDIFNRRSQFLHSPHQSHA